MIAKNARNAANVVKSMLLSTVMKIAALITKNVLPVATAWIVVKRTASRFFEKIVHSLQQFFQKGSANLLVIHFCHNYSSANIFEV